MPSRRHPAVPAPPAHPLLASMPTPAATSLSPEFQAADGDDETPGWSGVVHRTAAAVVSTANGLSGWFSNSNSNSSAVGWRRWDWLRQYRSHDVGVGRRQEESTGDGVEDVMALSSSASGGRGELTSSQQRRNSFNYRTTSPSSAKTQTQTGQVFGVPLNRLSMLREYTVEDGQAVWLPCVFVRCLEFFDRYGVDEVGIYRVSGNWRNVGSLRHVFDSGGDIDFCRDPTTDSHDIETLIKMYLRERIIIPIISFVSLSLPVPESIFTAKLYGDIQKKVRELSHKDQVDEDASSAAGAASPTVGAASRFRNILVEIPSMEAVSSPLPNETQVVRELVPLFQQLPAISRGLVHALGRHLSLVASHHTVNKMTLGNLGVLFCPTLGLGSVLFGLWIRNWQDLLSSDGNAEWRDAEAISSSLPPSPVDEAESYLLTPTISPVSESWPRRQTDILSMPADVGNLVQGIDLLAALEAHYGTDGPLRSAFSHQHVVDEEDESLTEDTGTHAHSSPAAPDSPRHLRSITPADSPIPNRLRKLFPSPQPGQRDRHLIPIELEREARRHQRFVAAEDRKKGNEQVAREVDGAPVVLPGSPSSNLLGFDYADEATGEMAVGVLNMNPRRRGGGTGVRGTAQQFETPAQLTE